MRAAELSARVLELGRDAGKAALEDEADRDRLEIAAATLARLGFWLGVRGDACPHCKGVGFVIRSGRTTRCGCQGEQP